MNLDAKEMFDAESFVSWWFGFTETTARDACTRDGTFDRLFVTYNKMFSAFCIKTGYKAKPISERLLQAAYNIYIIDKMDNELKQAMGGFKCVIPNLEPIIKFVTAATGRADELDIAIIAHWVWQVKRKATDKTVVNHIMPVFYGKQGGGKSVAVNNLIRPMKSFKLNMKMNQLGDERLYRALSQNFVVLFDELQGIERTDLNILKNQITTESNDYRRLHTHNSIPAPMRCSFIGATNKPLSENFSDNTGMRRFWEIVTLEKLDWDAINEIDYMELWKGVDENLPKGYLTKEKLALVSVAQEELVNADDLDEYIKETGITNEGPIMRIKGSDLFNAYCLWAGNAGIQKPLNKIWFGRKMKRRVKNEQEKTKSGVRRTVYIVNKAAMLEKEEHSEYITQ